MTTIEFIPKEEENQEVQKPEWYYCDACGDVFPSTTPPLPGQKLYEVHGCKRGKVQARLDNPTCLHCGAAKASSSSLCGCPADIAERKADDDATAKRNKEDNERYSAV